MHSLRRLCPTCHDAQSETLTSIRYGFLGDTKVPGEHRSRDVQVEVPSLHVLNIRALVLPNRWDADLDLSLTPQRAKA